MSTSTTAGARAGTSSSIAVWGAGRMGSALVRALLAGGHSVTVWNRTVSKCAPLAAAGARVASSVEDAVSGADVVIGNVSDYASTRALASSAAVTSALGGKLFVQLATGTPRHARELADWAREHGVRYLDGAIMATPDFIGKDGATLLYAGETGLFEEHRSVLASFGEDTRHVGVDPGHANALDAAILAVLWGSAFGALQGTALCEAERFPLSAFASALAATMPVLGAALGATVERIAARRYAADETTFSSVDTCYASARLIHEMSEEHGIHLALPRALDAVFRETTRAGHGDADLAAVYLAMTPPSSRSAPGSAP